MVWISDIRFFSMLNYESVWTEGTGFNATVLFAFGFA